MRQSKRNVTLSPIYEIVRNEWPGYILIVCTILLFFGLWLSSLWVSPSLMRDMQDSLPTDLESLQINKYIELGAGVEALYDVPSNIDGSILHAHYCTYFLEHPEWKEANSKYYELSSCQEVVKSKWELLYCKSNRRFSITFGQGMPKSSREGRRIADVLVQISWKLGGAVGCSSAEQSSNNSNKK